MAIAFDNSAPNNDPAVGTTDTVSYTVTGSNTAIVVGIQHTTSSNVSSITYDGVNLTQIHSNIVGEGTIRVDLWLLVGTSTGANDLVVTVSASDNFAYMIESYTGVFDGGSTGGMDSSASLSEDSSGDHTITYTTQSNNTCGAFYMRSQQNNTASTNVTFRESDGSVVRAIGDNNSSGFGTAGSHSQVVNAGVSGPIAFVGVALSSTAPSAIKKRNTVEIANIKTANTVE
jgi:hypothetical protein